MIHFRPSFVREIDFLVEIKLSQNAARAYLLKPNLEKSELTNEFWEKKGGDRRSGWWGTKNIILCQRVSLIFSKV